MTAVRPKTKPKTTEEIYETQKATGPLPPGVTYTQFGKMPEETPVDPKQAARAELKAYLDHIEFADGVDLVEQDALQDRYLDWAADVHAERRKIFGDDYRLGADMSPRYAEGFMNAIFEALCGAISSALRTPPRNAEVTALAPKPSTDPNAPPERPLGELAFAIDAMTLGGGVGGSGSFFAEKILVPALTEVAARHNLPKMDAVDKMALAPTPPPGVPRLVVRDGPDGRRVKQFYVPTRTGVSGQGRSGLGNVPTAREVRTEAERKQWWINFVQKALDEQNLGGLLGNPVVTGGYNAARRAASSAAALNAWDSVLGSSMLASGGAGATAKFVINALKTTPYVSQTWVDDLVGGRQRLNKYTPVGRGGGEDMAKWGDVKGLIPAAGEAAVEAAELFAEAFRHNPTLLIMDWFFRHVLPNVGVSIAAPGYGGLLAQAARLGKFDPQPGENVHSVSNIVQQFGTSFFNDLTWKALQNLMSVFTADLVKCREARREIATERLRDDRDDGVKRVSGYSVDWADGLRQRAEAGRVPRSDVDALPLAGPIALDKPADVAAAARSARTALDTLEAGAAPDPALMGILNRMVAELDKVVGIDEKLAKKKNK